MYRRYAFSRQKRIHIMTEVSPNWSSLSRTRIFKDSDRAPLWPPAHTRWEPLAEAIKGQLGGAWYQGASSRKNASMSKNINAGRLAGFVEAASWDGVFEAKALKTLWGEYDIYVRFVAF